MGSSVAYLLTPLAYLVGLAALLVPFFIFNLFASGTLLPNTFYAKNVEYAILLQVSPFPVRWLQLFIVPWIGAQILLLPGFVYIAAVLARRRQWMSLLPMIWVLCLPALYALRLPVAYQHGRYEMPVVPFIVLYGVWGAFVLFKHIRHWVVRQTWVGATVTLLLVFWYLGANAYATDVAIINCEMVETARWVEANAAPDALVAAHDIGALGYYYDRPLIDLAGLVTPDVIPFMRDQGRLRDYILSRGATLVIFFPDWYPDLDTDPQLQVVHRQDCPVAREAGGTDMTVYQVR